WGTHVNAITESTALSTAAGDEDLARGKEGRCMLQAHGGHAPRSRPAVDAASRQTQPSQWYTLRAVGRVVRDEERRRALAGASRPEAHPYDARLARCNRHGRTGTY